MVTSVWPDDVTPPTLRTEILNAASPPAFTEDPTGDTNETRSADRSCTVDASVVLASSVLDESADRAETVR